MRKLRLPAASVILVVASVACASKASTRENTTPAHTAEDAANIINAAALADPRVSGGDALEAVRRLRPQFLMTRGAVSIRSKSAGTVLASLDFGPLQGVDYLRRIRVTELSEIRYLDSRQAALRFGTATSTGGVIVVTTRK